MDEPTKDAIIKQQELIIRDLTTTNNALRIELAPHRQWNSFARQQPWRFALFLLLSEVWPFSLWYHRFDGGGR